MTEPEVAGEESIPKAIEFPDGLPGFPQARHFRLQPLDPDLAPFAALRSQDLEGLEFVVVPPGAVFEDYTVEVPDDDANRLDLREADDAVVMVIVTVSRPPTANLLGPLVVNRRTGRGRQVVMVGSDYDVRTPLPAG
ncbi:MAG TPA: flagellar assembly protein FliW [Acidimicrobiales bacterium]|nr:flagellar assembly protein FliW [Acidimicrobiales bacterium]